MQSSPMLIKNQSLGADSLVTDIDADNTLSVLNMSPARKKQPLVKHMASTVSLAKKIQGGSVDTISVYSRNGDGLQRQNSSFAGLKAKGDFEMGDHPDWGKKQEKTKEMVFNKSNHKLEKLTALGTPKNHSQQRPERPSTVQEGKRGKPPTVIKLHKMKSSTLMRTCTDAISNSSVERPAKAHLSTAHDAKLLSETGK